MYASYVSTHPLHLGWLYACIPFRDIMRTFFSLSLHTIKKEMKGYLPFRGLWGGGVSFLERTQLYILSLKNILYDILIYFQTSLPGTTLYILDRSSESVLMYDLRGMLLLY